jgi:hypothetical protein
MNYAIPGHAAVSASSPISSSRQLWSSVFSAYRKAFLSSRGQQGQNIAREFNYVALENILHEILVVSNSAAVNDALILDVHLSPNQYGDARERVSNLFFRAGYRTPLIWASRDVLLKENRHSGLLARLLPSHALGFAPDLGLDEVENISNQKGRILAIGVRGELALPDQRSWKISVIVPAFNEADTIETVLDQILGKRIPGVTLEVCVVESNSTDGTREKVLAYQGRPHLKIVLEQQPKGKGHAVRAGLEMATGDIIVIQDADLEYDIDDYEKLISPIRAYETSFVLGSRHPAGENLWQIRSFEGQQKIASLLNLGHIFFTWLLNFTFRQRLRDPFTMFKVFRRDAIENMRFECNRFDFDLELVGKLIRAGRFPLEIDVHYKSRSFDEGKKVSFFRDPPTWVRACFQHRFSSLYKLPNPT